MVAPAQVIESARACHGTLYHHQGRLKGVGLDCIGLVMHVCKDLGLGEFEEKGYGRVPDGQLLKRRIEEHCTPLPEMVPGALLLFRIRTDPQHCGIATDSGKFIHAYQGCYYVAEGTLDSRWSKRIVQVYALPGVTY